MVANAVKSVDTKTGKNDTVEVKETKATVLKDCLLGFFLNLI